ncbi:MAG: hypothetical protein Q8O38_17535 [Sulfurimicrobium sp.]|nr:hypothetical protein [Sulfurimicrobium sp.]
MTKQWLKAAPERLVLAFQNREIGNGRALLERLLCDDRMRFAWKEIAPHVQDDQQWIEVWSAIVYAKRKSNQAGRLRKRRSDERDVYRVLANKFSTLAKGIENGPLDVLAYELFPQDVLEALHVRQRSDVGRILSCWPGASELLRGLEMRALMLADDAMSKPRADDRGSGNVAARTFVWYLGQDFHTMFGQQMLGTLARITEVTFNSDEGFNRSFVQSALSGCIAKRGGVILR